MNTPKFPAYFLTACLVIFGNHTALAEPVDLETMHGDELKAFMGERDVVFYAIDTADKRSYAYAPDKIDTRQIPYSTFKIPNLLIALEAGVEGSLEHKRTWDCQQRPAADFWPESWRRDHSLETAFRHSVVWYFRDIALEVGGDQYRNYLEAFDYGNADAPDNNDDFWLHGPLKISPREQVLFLERLVAGGFELNPGHIEGLRRASLLVEEPGYSLHGKTGAGPTSGTGFESEFGGWIVGWVAYTDKAPTLFALYMRGPDFSSIASFRQQMATRFLATIGALPEA